jgi:hypothetical protein
MICCSQMCSFNKALVIKIYFSLMSQAQYLDSWTLGELNGQDKKKTAFTEIRGGYACFLIKLNEMGKKKKKIVFEQVEIVNEHAFDKCIGLIIYCQLKIEPAVWRVERGSPRRGLLPNYCRTVVVFLELIASEVSLRWVLHFSSGQSSLPTEVEEETMNKVQIKSSGPV